MNAVKWTLLALVAVLLVYSAIDTRHTQQQLIEIHRSLESLRQNVGSLRSAPIPSPTPAPTATVPSPVADPQRSGEPRLGANFLLPYDRSAYRPERRRGTLRMFEESPRRLNPLLDNSLTTSEIYGYISDTLCTRPPATPEKWQEALAEAVVIGDDWTTFTFTLRPGIRWQKPSIAAKAEYAWLDRDFPLTAHDFVFALDLTMDPVVDCPSLRNYYEDLARWEALDDRTLKLTWKRKVYTSVVASLAQMPLPRHIYGCNRDGTPIAKERLGATFNQHWFDELNTAVGVGAYRLDAYEPDKRIRFTVDPSYYGTPLHFDAIEWNMEVRKPDPKLVAFKNGQAHADTLMPLKYKSEILDRNEPRFAAPDPQDPQAGRKGELGWERYKRMAFTYLGWNMRRPPFDDRRVRQAMSHAFPKERILQEVYFGLGIPILSDVHPDSQYCNRDLKPYAFDLAKAAALLDEAGWRDTDGDGIRDRMVDGARKPFRFEMKYIANMSEWDNTLLIFKDTLRRIGVAMEPKPFEWKELVRIYEDKDFVATVGGWGQAWDKDFFQLWHSSQADVQGGSNHCGFKSPRVDRLAEELRATFDITARIRIAKEIQAVIHEEQPYTFFRSVQGIFIWQNQGDPQHKERWLDGVVDGFDKLHPLVNRQPVYWHFR